MQLFIVRHGIATSNAPTDADRELTPEGRSRFAAGVRGLGVLGVRLGRAYSSPLLRAVQTAELLEPLLDGPRQVLEPLGHEPDTEIFELLGGESTALVGHEPWQSQLAAWLVSGDRRGSGLGLAPGGVIALEGQARPRGMHLRGFWSPDDLIAIGSR